MSTYNGSNYTRLAISSARVILAAIIMLIAVTAPAPVFAINGRDAVNTCIDITASGARCGWAVDKQTGGIDVCNKSGCVHCDSASAECTLARKTHPPQRSLPVGTTITTEMGSFKVSAKVHNGPLLKAPPAESKK
jgi:hypothetical protein